MIVTRVQTTSFVNALWEEREDGREGIKGITSVEARKAWGLAPI